MCPAFPGCHVEGEAYEETIEEMIKAINAFITDYSEDNEPLPEDDVTVTFLKVAV